MYMHCSRRRKTKEPFCEEDPNCYWDKSCKNNTRRVKTKLVVFKHQIQQTN